MKKIIFLALLLPACAYTHEPTLSEPPKDLAKYEIDVKECRDDAINLVTTSDRMREAATPSGVVVADILLGGLGGALGGAMGASMKQDSIAHLEFPDQGKGIVQLTDECMVERGYKVVMER